MNEKKFDSVEMKRKGSLKIYVEIKDLSLEEQIAYWRGKSEIFRKEQEVIKSKPKPVN